MSCSFRFVFFVTGIFEMKIQTQYWHRSIKMESWAVGTEKSFIRILFPKKEKGIQSLESQDSDNKADFSIQVTEKTIFTNFVEDIRKSLRYYMKTNPQAYFNKLYLSGGSANLLGLKDFIADNLNSKVELLDPFEKITLNQKLDNPYQYSVAVGCALRGLEK